MLSKIGSNFEEMEQFTEWRRSEGSFQGVHIYLRAISPNFELSVVYTHQKQSNIQISRIMRVWKLTFGRFIVMSQL
jgi:hypothetical protein